MISKYLAYNKKVSVIYADTTELIEYVKKIQNLSFLTTRIMSEFYTATSLMAFSEIKEESDEMIIQLKGDGPVGVLYSDVKLKEKDVLIKGFVENPSIDLKNHNDIINVSDIVGKNGNLAIIKNNKYTKLGYKGITPLISGNILDEFKNYYENSTQKPAYLGVKLIDNFKCIGYLITFMPDATEKEISLIKEKIADDLKVEALIKDNKQDLDFVKNLIGDEELIKLDDNLNVIYKCDCSKDKYKDMLASMKKAELEQILKEDEKINIVCQFCNKSYDFSKKEIEEIIEKM